MKRGVFITFEGVEGSGKTSQIKLLADAWRKRSPDKKIVLTREPGGTPFADQIRSILLDAKNKNLSSEEELFLYEIARRDHVSDLIRPALTRGHVVLCDRFTDATLAYQGYGRGLSKRRIKILNEVATGGLKPDLTLLLDLPAKEGLKRAKKRSKTLDRLEREALNFHERIRRGYLTLARKEKRFRIIRADRPVREVLSDILREVEKFF